MKRLQQEFKGDRQRLNEEMMKLYQEHKVNPLASCFPLILQMPVFFGMFSLLRGLTRNVDSTTGFFVPRIIDSNTKLYKDLSKSKEMLSWGLDLAKSPAQMLKASPGKGVLYILFVVLLAILYWWQQRMIANRTVSPTMSATQAKVMQYLPVAFAIFQVFFPMGMVLYYIWQTVLRIGQQAYITRRFYHHDLSLGRQAQQASAQAREIGKTDKTTKTAPDVTGKAGRPAAPGRGSAPSRGATPSRGAARPTGSTGGKGRPTPSGRSAKPAPPARPAAPAARQVPQKPVKPVKPVKPQNPKKPQA
jgi:YidC/Oxa1 family membrane protein insertase